MTHISTREIQKKKMKWYLHHDSSQCFRIIRNTFSYTQAEITQLILKPLKNIQAHETIEVVYKIMTEVTRLAYKNRKQIKIYKKQAYLVEFWNKNIHLS